MPLLRISGVSYINSLPFIYGIERSGFIKDYLMELDVPSECAKKLNNNNVDIALLPVGALAGNNYKIISDYCIGAVGEVASVLLLGNRDISTASRIILDTDSRTSVLLTRLLSKLHWNIKPEFIDNSSTIAISDNDFVLVIGDKALLRKQEFSVVKDLAQEWQNFSGLPFVFAVWASNKEIPYDTINSFNKALKWGLERREYAVKSDRRYKYNLYVTDMVYYINNNISYELDKNKLKGMNLFLELSAEL